MVKDQNSIDMCLKTIQDSVNTILFSGILDKTCRPLQKRISQIDDLLAEINEFNQFMEYD